MESAQYAYIKALLEKEKNRQIELIKKFVDKNPCRTSDLIIRAQAIESAIEVLEKNQKKEN